AISVLLWTRFVTAYLNTHGKFAKFLLGSGWVILTYQIVALIINCFIPIFFGFSAEKEYLPGKARYITLFIQMGLYLSTSIYTLAVAVKTDGEEKAHHRTIGFSGIVMTVFIALQSFFPLMPFYAIGCLFATCMIHSFVYKDETAEMGREIGTAKQMAYRDPLTGVKSKLAYLERLGDLEGRVEAGSLSKYGVVVFDVNGLKKINDTLGHDEGDEYIRSACRLICEQFKHSPVFRIGGDEFVAILEGEDYENREDLLKSFETAVEEYRANGKVVVSSGMAVYQTETDDSYNDVFKRADKKMYERKGYLKGI
ncbi:MAG: GGDEF domain-containing protein, partial [Alphaproteobacteria bacterium]